MPRLPSRSAQKKAVRRPAVRIEPGIDFEGSHVLYHVTVRNRGEGTARDVVITPRIVHGPFVIDDPPKAVPLLKPGTFGTATFRILARGEPGELEVGGRVSHWDPGTDERHEASVTPVRVDLRPPATRPVYLDPAALRERASRAFSVQDSFALPTPAERAFPLVEDALSREGLEVVEAMTYVSGDTYVGQASFHGLDTRRSSYAVRAVVARRGETSSVKLHVFVQAEERLFGFYWRVRDAVQRALGLSAHQP